MLRRGHTAPIPVKIQTMGLDPKSANLERVYEALEPLIHEKIELTEPEVEAVIRTAYNA